MIAPWLLYASIFGGLGGLAMLLGERIARWREQSTRWAWLALIVGMVGVPVLLDLLPRSPGADPLSTRLPSPVEHAIGPLLTPSPAGHWGAADRVVLTAWIFMSALLVLRVIVTAIALRRRARRWPATIIDGYKVLLADDLGPAVIGWQRFVTVVPRWALEFDESWRTLMLEHEAEHARAGDPHLRTVALAALILMPWNPALWWAVRRLRLAIEIDCDRRLVDGGADRRSYAALLLAVTERSSTTPFAWATAFGGSRSSLEHRIVAITRSRLPRSPRLAVACASVAIFLVALAGCATPVPDPVMPPDMLAATVAVNAARDSIEALAVSHCETRYPCRRGAADNYVFHDGRGDNASCGITNTCAWQRHDEHQATGDSLVRRGDTVYAYRISDKVSAPRRIVVKSGGGK